MSSSWMPKGFQSTVEPTIAFQMPPDGQTLQMQFMLQVFFGRTIPTGTHTQAQRVETFEDPYLSILREVLHAGDIFVQTYAKACRTNRQKTAK